MVMKSYFQTEKQQQKRQQLHQLRQLYSHDQKRTIFANDCINCSSSSDQVSVDLPSEHLCHKSGNDNRNVDYSSVSKYKFGDNDDHVVSPASKKVPFKGSSEKRRRFQSATFLSRLTFVLVVVISLLADKLVHGASLNSSTLAGDLLMNSSHDATMISAESIGTNNTTNSSTSQIPTTGSSRISALPRNIISHNNTATTASATTTSSTTILPPYAQDSNRGNLNISQDENHGNGTTAGHSSPSSPPPHNDNDHINFTLPIQVTSDSAIVVKHGSIIYEVINNGTVSTSFGTFTVPVITSGAVGTPPVSDPHMGLYEKMTATVLGLRVEETAKGVSYTDGASKILANSPSVIRFFGIHFTNNTVVRFVSEEGKRGTDCDDVKSTKYFHFDNAGLTQHSAVTTVTIPPLNDGDRMYYVCVREINTGMPWVHQGPEQWIMITTYQKWLPVWAHIALLILLLTLSGLFSGLNLGLMAIDRTEIKIIMNAGSEAERRHAKKIRPLRDNGNYLLCSLLLGNVLVNATLTILLDDLTSGIIAVVGSTVGIVIFGEIVPQAVCSRHGLAVGAKTVWITKFFMAVTFPLSYPISIILNKVLGEEIGNVYNRERLKELIRVTQGENDLEKDEMNIIAGALDLKQKTVVDVMTRLEDVYMLPIDAVLDFDTVSEIMSNGYSRIPVYENQRGNVISLLYAKDLAFVDPDDRMPLRTICEFYNNPCHFVFENVKLNILFNVFKQGNRGHMAFVQRIKSSDKADPVYEVIGLVTMEDVIEELIQEEINDETDVWETDNKRRSQSNYTAITDVTMPHLKTEGTIVSRQLTLAAFQYLSTAVEEFHDNIISKSVLDRMLKQNIYFHIKLKPKDSTKIDPITILYERGKPADYFIMILEGRVHAEIGKENLVFESGPFSFFGTNSLVQNPGGGDNVSLTPSIMRKISQTSLSESAMLPTYIPDYTVRAVTDLTYFQISRSMYLAAKQATLLERTVMSEEKIDEQVLNHLDEVLEAADGKPKETSITMAKSTGRGSISENYQKQICNFVDLNVKTRVKGLKEGSRNISLVTVPQIQQQLKQQTPIIGDNNNICKTITENGDIVSTDKKEELGRSNMSRVILCPNEEKPLPPEILLQDANFPARTLVEGDENLTNCKL